MERPQLAVSIAMAMVLAGLTVAVVPTPTTAASSTNCPSPADFGIPDLEPSDSRDLLAGETKIGIENVTALEGDNELHVELRSSNDEMEWSVYHRNSNDECVEYTATDCDGPNTIQKEDDPQTCTLEAPGSGQKSYWVVNTNPQLADDLDFANWAPVK